MVVKMPNILASIGVKKTLPFKKFLNNELNKIRGSGLLQNIMTSPKENCPLDEKLMPITLPKMVFLFTVFVIGGILSIIIFIIERAISNKKYGTLDKHDSKQFNMNTAQTSESNEIGGECNQYS